MKYVLKWNCQKVNGIVKKLTQFSVDFRVLQ